MRKLTSSDLKDLNLLKHYRIIRKWACKTNELTDADLELLIYLDAIDMFTKDDFIKGNALRKARNADADKLAQELLEKGYKLNKKTGKLWTNNIT